jgi:hypothetical protein
MLKIKKLIHRRRRKNMNKNFLMIDGQKIPFTDEQVEKIKHICGVGKVKLSDLAEGECFKIGDVELIKFYEKSGGVYVVAKEHIASMKFGDSNNFKESEKLRSVLDEFLQKIVAAVGEENVLTFDTNLLALDGTDEYGSMTSKVGLPTLDFYRANKRIFDKHKLDKWWWLATPDSTTNNFVLCVAPSGGIFYDDCCHDCGGVRPFCILKSDIFVSCEE